MRGILHEKVNIYFSVISVRSTEIDRSGDQETAPARAKGRAVHHPGLRKKQRNLGTLVRRARAIR
jgi:hypothetical protein